MKRLISKFNTAWVTAAALPRLARLIYDMRGKHLLLIDSHAGYLTGNALGLAIAAQESDDFVPVYVEWPRFLSDGTNPLGSQIPKRLGIESFALGPVVRWLYQRATVIAYTGYYRHQGKLTQRPLRLQLWHGMPLKAIGFLGPESIPRPVEKCDIAIATSALTANIISRSFEIPLSKVALTAEPKTDPLGERIAEWQWSSHLKRQHKYLIAYVPTWREGTTTDAGGLRQTENSAGLAAVIQRLIGNSELKRLLIQHGAALVVRTHFMNAEHNIKCEPPFYLMDASNGEASHLLEQADLVIADYSSLIVDALLFDRPMILWCEDYDEYTRWTSFPYFDFTDTFGWAIVRESSELLAWLEDRLGNKPLTKVYEERLARTKAVFHATPRGGAGQRLLQHLRDQLTKRPSGQLQ